MIIQQYSDQSHNTLLPKARVLITAVIILLLCNQQSCCSLVQILCHYQLIAHFNPRTIRAATILLYPYLCLCGQIALTIILLVLLLPLLVTVLRSVCLINYTNTDVTSVNLRSLHMLTTGAQQINPYGQLCLPALLASLCLPLTSSDIARAMLYTNSRSKLKLMEGDFMIKSQNE